MRFVKDDNKFYYYKIGKPGLILEKRRDDATLLAFNISMLLPENKAKTSFPAITDTSSMFDDSSGIRH